MRFIPAMRNAGLGLLALAVLAVLTAPQEVEPAAAAMTDADAPNIVVIMTDDQTLESMKVMSRTSALIGSQGTTYTNYVVTDSLCCPSRATYLTGQYVFNHGVLSNTGVNGGYPAFDNSTALPVWLQGAGYRTAHVGKFLNGYGKAKGTATVVPQGWNDWQGQIDINYYNYRLNDNGSVVNYGAIPASYSTDVFATRAEQVIAESAPGGPFYLNVALNAPHTENNGPPIPAPRHNSAYANAALPKPPNFNEADVSDKPGHIQSERRVGTKAENKITARYREELESLLSVDELVERVVDALDTAGELSNTVIMFTSDNGFFQGEHRVRSGKLLPYEESIHMPLMVRGPGFASGASVGALAANIDLAPTIAAIAGATPMLPVDGINLKTVASAGRQEVVIEGYAQTCFTGLRTATEMYARYYSGEQEYYNLATDPYQLNSEHASQAARVTELRNRLNVLHPAPLPPCQTAAG